MLASGQRRLQPTHEQHARPAKLPPHRSFLHQPPVHVRVQALSATLAVVRCLAPAPCVATWLHCTSFFLEWPGWLGYVANIRMHSHVACAMAPSTSDAHRVQEVRALVRRPLREQAEAMLERIAKQVQPIMRRRRWRCLKLTEMFPKNPSLLGLNVNRGQEIKIRLRPHYDENTFLPYEDLLGTMLHELTHNVHGPHNAAFYKLLDEIREECEELMARGISGTGDGFDAPSCGKLGGRTTVHNPPEHMRRATALRAAEERKAQRALMPSGGRKLGGGSSTARGLSPREAAARAAERRLKDNLWCPNEGMSSDTDMHSLSRTHEETSAPCGCPIIIDLTDTDDEGKEETSTRKRKATHCTNNTDNFTVDHPNSTWTCKICTLRNKGTSLRCLACLEERKSGEGRAKTWSCKFCTLYNDEQTPTCSACGQWRYATGPPVSTTKVFST